MLNTLREARVNVKKLKPRRAVGHSEKNDLLQCLLDCSQAAPVADNDRALVLVDD